MLDEPKTNSEYVYNYRDGSGIKYKGTPFNTAGWTTVEIAGKIIEKMTAPNAICEPFVSKKLDIAFPNDEGSPLL